MKIAKIPSLRAARRSTFRPAIRFVDEALGLVEKYRSQHDGWNVKHFHSWYQREGGTRSYTWVKKTLQENGAVRKAPGKGKHRKRRERAAWEGMLIHQDASRHAWVPAQLWDLLGTMDDATNEHYSMFFVAEEGTASSFQGMREVIGKKGLPSAIYTDRGSHYWIPPEAGGKVEKKNLTPFGRPMKQLGIEMIAAYSPEARGRSERAFRTIRSVFPKNSPWRESRRWKRPTPPCPRSIFRLSIPNFPIGLRRTDRPSFPGPESLLTRSSASITNGSLATTTACLSKDGSFRSLPIGTGFITSGRPSGSTGIPTYRSPCFMDPGSFPTILSKNRSSR